MDVGLFVCFFSPKNSSKLVDRFLRGFMQNIQIFPRRIIITPNKLAVNFNPDTLITHFRNVCVFFYIYLKITMLLFI